MNCFNSIIINLSKIINNDNIDNNIINDISTSITKIIPEVLLTSKIHGNRYKISSKKLLFNIVEIFIKKNNFIKFLMLLLGGITISNDNSNLKTSTITSIGHIIFRYCKENDKIKKQIIPENILNFIFEIITNLLKSNVEIEVSRVIIKLLKVLYSTFNEYYWIKNVTLIINLLLD